jgi:hypothetical protein
MNAKTWRAAVSVLFKHLLEIALTVTVVLCATRCEADTAQFQNGVFPDETYLGHVMRQIRFNESTLEAWGQSGPSQGVGRNGQGSIRTVHGYDISSIPSTATITSVTLTVQIKVGNGVDTDFNNPERSSVW